MIGSSFFSAVVLNMLARPGSTKKTEPDATSRPPHWSVRTTGHNKVKVIHQLNFYRRVYIMYTQPALWLDCVIHLSAHNPIYPLLSVDCAYKYTMEYSRESKSGKSVD